MNVLLLSMPDYFEHMPPVAVRMPNGALTRWLEMWMITTASPLLI